MELVSKIYRIRRRRLVWIYLISALLVFYFIFHLINGRNGIKSYRLLQARYAQLSAEVKRKNDAINQLQQKLEMLKPESLNNDFVETLAREVLGYSRENEIVINRPKL